MTTPDYDEGRDLGLNHLADGVINVAERTVYLARRAAIRAIDTTRCARYVAGYVSAIKTADPTYTGKDMNGFYRRNKDLPPDPNRYNLPPARAARAAPPPRRRRRTRSFG